LDIIYIIRIELATTFAKTSLVLAAASEWRLRMLLSVIRFLQVWKRYNASVSELSRLGDRELADIGISRSDISRVAWNNANND
jgi:uncharacterized protein YjiS (DUF1127 family)